MFESAASGSLTLGHQWEKSRCQPCVVALRVGNAVALRVFMKLIRPLRNFIKGVARFAGGQRQIGNVADGRKESATTKSVRPIGKTRALVGRIIVL